MKKTILSAALFSLFAMIKPSASVANTLAELGGESSGAQQEAVIKNVRHHGEKDHGDKKKMKDGKSHKKHGKKSHGDKKKMRMTPEEKAFLNSDHKDAVAFRSAKEELKQEHKALKKARTALKSSKKEAAGDEQNNALKLEMVSLKNKVDAKKVMVEKAKDAALSAMKAQA